LKSVVVIWGRLLLLSIIRDCKGRKNEKISYMGKNPEMQKKFGYPII